MWPGTGVTFIGKGTAALSRTIKPRAWEGIRGTTPAVEGPQKTRACCGGGRVQKRGGVKTADATEENEISVASTLA